MDESKVAPSIVPSDVQGTLRAKASREMAWGELINRLQSGDQNALATLYDESSPLVYGLAFRILGNTADAEEVTLDVYKQIWKTARDYDPARGSVSAWIVMLARTRAIDRQRHASTRTRVEQSIEDSARWHTTQPGPEEQTAASEAQRRLKSALKALADEQREAIELAFFSGLTHSELSAHLGAPLGTVKTRIRQGMLKLRRDLDQTEFGARM